MTREEAISKARAEKAWALAKAWHSAGLNADTLSEIMKLLLTSNDEAEMARAEKPLEVCIALAARQTGAKWKDASTDTWRVVWEYLAGWRQHDGLSLASPPGHA